MNLYEVAREISDRLTGTFLQDAAAAGPCTAGSRCCRPTRTGATCVLFYEYFHGDNGAGIGASHQTGWTGRWPPPPAVPRLNAERLLTRGRGAPRGQRPADGGAAMRGRRAQPVIYEINTAVWLDGLSRRTAGA